MGQNSGEAITHNLNSVGEGVARKKGKKKMEDPKFKTRAGRRRRGSLGVDEVLTGAPGQDDPHPAWGPDDIPSCSGGGGR